MCKANVQQQQQHLLLASYSSSTSSSNSEQQQHKDNKKEDKSEQVQEDNDVQQHSSWKMLLLTGVQIMGYVYLIRTYVLDYSMCTGSSMLPTLNDHGDFVLVDKTQLRPIKRDDLIMAVSPVDPAGNICKRVRYLAGDVIEYQGPLGIVRRMQIPEGYVWVEGDNAKTSFDSRNYGPVPLSLVKGRVICRVYPFSWLDTPWPASTSTTRVE
ncbi:hypothetical protein SAMD00019534_079060 [Acytostelium subglobosum LB1]|uniref:hypothetical protein n=1 Tax=Acytostelium subglobosum LB1 TaxID=1410327 RepID=UPI000644DDC1|nr:hypothetical protein SAMD00019534_079060 [Acytostelium subglobosum LB1]GAM24731.1 hypothetical protein SAMD00019534_079060 [Acytostelium subglobosum LB1]|eukprot:XP_012752400.1 hypothetical protein SAMD00019534_079060 [Acytostelium subglobosum LB1]